MFSVEMLPAQRGDCLWLTYGEGNDRYHVLIDAGPRETLSSIVPELERRIAGFGPGSDRVELLVVTHIDADHIQGVVSLLSGPRMISKFRDIWFNGWQHVSGVLGAKDGERLGALLDAQPRWNRAFGGRAAVVPESDADRPVALPTVRLRGGLTLTLLSPDLDGLARVAAKWKEECRRAGVDAGGGLPVPRTWQRREVLGFDPDALAGGVYRRDPSAANRSSIAFIASYGRKHVLLAADAHAEVLAHSLRRLGPGVHRFDAVKLAHHGSRGNVSMAFLDLVSSRRWLISTDGSTFHHPDADALARIVVTQRRPELIFNYMSDEPHVRDVIAGAGDRYTVRVPRRRRDGTHETGITVDV